MTQLDRLLFEQGGNCFFCHKNLSKSEASVEHLVAKANGGPNHEDNCVVCCKALNSLLGSKTLKHKIQVVLNQKGSFKCPAQSAPTEEAATKPATVVAPQLPAESSTALRAIKIITPKRRTFVVAPVSPLPKTAQAPVKEVNAVTCPTCKHSVPSVTGQVDYKCQACGGAFRY